MSKTIRGSYSFNPIIVPLYPGDIKPGEAPCMHPEQGNGIEGKIVRCFSGLVHSEVFTGEIPLFAGITS